MDLSTVRIALKNFSKLFRISFPKKTARALIFPNNNKDVKQSNAINTEKEIVFNKLKSNLDNFNILKNIQIYK